MAEQSCRQLLESVSALSGGNQKKWCIDKRKKAKTTKENGNDLGLDYEKSTRHIELAIHLVYRA